MRYHTQAYIPFVIIPYAKLSIAGSRASHTVIRLVTDILDAAKTAFLVGLKTFQ